MKACGTRWVLNHPPLIEDGVRKDGVDALEFETIRHVSHARHRLRERIHRVMKQMITSPPREACVPEVGKLT